MNVKQYSAFIKKFQKRVLAAIIFWVPQRTIFPSVNANTVEQIWLVMTFHLAMLNKKTNIPLKHIFICNYFIDIIILFKISWLHFCI